MSTALCRARGVLQAKADTLLQLATTGSSFISDMTADIEGDGGKTFKYTFPSAYR